MRTAMRPRYYCDHCNKGNGSPSAMKRHESAAWNGKVKAGAPFWELVNFADNEGTIGPVAAAKLLRDFIEFDERSKDITESHFYEGYCDLRRGLELAADGGALDFH